jgi:hypothetical protein
MQLLAADLSPVTPLVSVGTPFVADTLWIDGDRAVVAWPVPVVGSGVVGMGPDHISPRSLPTSAVLDESAETVEDL